MDIALKKQYSEFYSELYENIAEEKRNSIFSITKPPKIKRQKYSFTSDPGAYFSMPKSQTSNRIVSGKDKYRPSLLKNRFVFRQSSIEKQIFENEVIVNEMVSKQMSLSLAKVNLTQVTGEDLKIGIGNRNSYYRKTHTHQQTNS